MLLKVQNITKRFGGLIAVANLSFSVEKGEILGLIGPNGAGKTTFMNVLSGTFPAMILPIKRRTRSAGGESAGLIRFPGPFRT
jgi:ABC-type branched-subunit amino acid transport system ATPase component